MVHMNDVQCLFWKQGISCLLNGRVATQIEWWIYQVSLIDSDAFPCSVIQSRECSTRKRKSMNDWDLYFRNLWRENRLGQFFHWQEIKWINRLYTIVIDCEFLALLFEVENRLINVSIHFRNFFSCALKQHRGTGQPANLVNRSNRK